MTYDARFLIISKAIACPTRLFLLGVLGVDGCTVTEAADAAEVTVSTASHHLRHLVGAGLARMQRRGRTHVYRWSRDRWYLVCRPVEDQPDVT